MSIADKLALLADTKEALRVKLDLGVDVPFSEYVDYIKQQNAITRLFLNGKQGVWYDPSDKSTLFQDVAGTVPVTKDGDPVGKMLDKSGNGNHAVQTTSTARPVYKTDGILHRLEFDGVDDFLMSQNTDFLGNVSATYTLGLKMYNSKDSFCYRSITTTGFDDFTMRLNGGNHAIYENSPNAYTTLSAGLLTTKCVATAKGTAASWVSRNNAIQIATRSSGAALNPAKQDLGQKLVVGGSYGESDFGKMDFYGLVLMDVELDAINLDVVEDYIAQKTGVTL